ncbi:LysM peptidoglycan-binding domain-containing protein [Geomobilimonas luticola]|uniref:Tetratricopeptide repeat protein n=1 Tax=Geomobilimonas luticola TaxID=1114878 RepID=A0ABS5SDF3_9BACT|nr:tetratricopeptide repeat protein [Geomobilimonas luticola]MBT0653407.1 tetratricopeptide repeat protein [Geomobilimonas luticola]
METKRIVFMLMLLVAGAPALAIAGDEYNLYTPHKVASGQAPSSPEEGVLTRTITIRRGDTLWGLSRKYTGAGSYYPQILPFNVIENPDLIYAGASLQVPVARGTSAEASVKPVKAVQPPKGTKATKARHTATARKEKQHEGGEKAAAAVHTPAIVAPAVPAARTVSPAAASESGSQRDYQRAVTIYKKGEYREALDAFDAFLARHPDSPLAPDATLYRADCYMKLSER